MKRFLIGTTVQFTWVSSGAAPSSIYTAIYTGSETMINSVAMTSTGNGHFNSGYTVSNTPGFYVGETKAVVSGFPYKKRIRFQVILEEVD